MKKGGHAFRSQEGGPIVSRRLAAQRLSFTPFHRPEEVVAWFGAIQAQDYLGSLWAIGLRHAESSAARVERALAERAIVRSWPMRGTLHFMAAADARWMVELLAPRTAAAAANRLRKMGIDAPLLAKARRVLVKALEGGRSLTRPAAYRLLDASGVATTGNRGLHLLWSLAHEGLICFGPRDGKQQALVLLEEWLPNSKRLASADEGLAEIARRYYTSHGPATARDLAWWAGLTLGQARRATEAAEPSLDREGFDGEPYWFSGTACTPVETQAAPCRTFALPPYDEFFVGYADRTAAIDPSHAARLTPFDILGPVMLHHGRLAATWKRTLSGKTVHFSLSPLDPPPPATRRAMDQALSRYASFLGK